MKALVLLFLPVLVWAQGSKSVHLNGTLQLQRPVSMVAISYRTADGAVTDSFKLRNGTFTYKTTLQEPTLATLLVRYQDAAPGEKREAISFFLQPGKLTLTAADTLKNYTLTGSAAQADFLQLAAQEKPYADSLEKLYEVWDGYAHNKEAQEAVEAQIDSVDAVLRENVYAAFVRRQPQSPVALYAVKQYAGYDMDPGKVEPLFAALPEQTRQWPSAVVLKESIELAKKTGIGQTALNFTQTDTAGTSVSLSDFRGKYVLVDFWASWCGPCRNENPNVVKAFNQYKDKGFTVLGVSLDRPGAKERWLKAIHDDGLTWTHVSDLKFWENAVAKSYGIRAIPQNFLIDPQGKIIGRNLRGSALTKKLAQVLDATASN